MNLRNLPEHISSTDRCSERRQRIEQELGLDLSALTIDPTKIGHAEERNCEQMFGHVPIPMGYAGPLPVIFSSGETADIHLPLATTEGALVASVNRGCKALRMSGGVTTTSVYHGVSRSMALKMSCHIEPVEMRHGATLRRAQDDTVMQIQKRENEWKAIGEATSKHLKILKHDIDTKDDYIFLTIYADTDEAMGMNMVTIAAEAIGKWLVENIDLPAGRSSSSEGWELITIAANVDSDKKPSKRIHDRGRGYEITATARVPIEVLQSVLKTTPEAILEVAHAKLELGSTIAGAIGHNCHAANIIAALYLATGQDPAHVVEGSLADTTLSVAEVREPQLRSDDSGVVTPRNGININIRCPALLVGMRGGGTTLPAQSQCLNLLLKSKVSGLKSPQQLAESIGAAVLAGELSLLAALSSHKLGKAHQYLGRGQKAKTVQKGQTYDTVPSCQ